jgi:hypothetical protein
MPQIIHFDMKRRKFLTIAGVGGVVAALASFKFITHPFESVAKNIIKSELDYLKLDEEGLDKFVADYTKLKDRNYKLTMKGYSLFGINSAKSGKVHQLVTAYLLSSDFFQNKMDETRTIKYVGLYDPYRRPCTHPFSHAYYS